MRRLKRWWLLIPLVLVLPFLPKGQLPHLHYSVLTLIPYPWRADRSTQGWKKMLYLNPIEVLR